ncbi:MAG: DUF1343 domain-containing protein, partial [Bacteroidota bacterium]
MVVKVKVFVALLALLPGLNFSCETKKLPAANEPAVSNQEQLPENQRKIIVGAERMQEYLPLLQGKKIALVVNHTSLVGETHLADTLFQLGIQIEKIFAPEHGFRGTASDGETVKDSKDAATGIPILSLYGSKKKPDRQDLANLDLVIFDIQDVGARFYTFIYTMTYVMEACAENNLPLLVLDRPNPNGHFVDGNILKPSHRSFVGLHEIPVVNGMTVGEYAKMVNGEGWLAGGVRCDLKVIACENYDHRTAYDLPVKPSPNLPNMRAVYLYPSICFFEGTVVSVGRGTDKQFQVIGAPGFEKGNFSFTPRPMEGAKNPPQEGKVCNGYDLTHLKPEDLRQRNTLDLSY